MFLYRSPIETMDSFCVAFARGLISWVRFLGLDGRVMAMDPFFTENVPKASATGTRMF